MKVCKGGKNCGWNEHGHYECYCYSPKTDKVSRIKEILGHIDWTNWPRSAWDKDYEDLTEALSMIQDIVEE